MTTPKIEKRKLGKLTRSFSLSRETADKEARTVAIAFSSETPYERFFGTEILDHEPKSIRLGRLTDGGALLLDHDMTRHVGVIEEVSIGDDRVGRAVVRFGRSEQAEEAFQDVLDGIRRHVSVGYLVHRMEEDRDEETFRVTDWEPIEISLVSVPADPSVGVGRAVDDAEGVSTEIVLRKVDDPPPIIIPPKGIVTMTSPTTKEPAELERDRVSTIIALGEMYAKWIEPKLVRDAITSGRSVEAFKDAVLSAMETKHTDTSAMHIGMTKQEAKRYSFGRALVATLTGDWSKAGFERECSDAVTRLVGSGPEGFFVPYDVFRRDFNVGTSTEAGNLVPTELRGDLYVDALRNALVMPNLGVRVLTGLTGNIDMPRKSTPTTVGMLSEIGSAAETNPLTAKVTLSPKRVGGFVEVSKQALIQSALALEGMIRDDLLVSAAIQIEQQALSGVGSTNQMLGLRNTAGVGVVAAGANGGTLTWGHLVNLESACANANAEPDQVSGYLTNTRVRGAAKQVQKGTNLPFIWENGATPLNGYRAGITNNVPSNLTKGTSTGSASAMVFGSDWSMAVLGLFGAPDVTVDPYTKADTGQVKITLNQFADFGVRQPAAFSKIEDLLTP